MAEENFYQLLDVSQDATQAEIKSRFRQLALQHHPDHGGDAQAFRQLEEAYETLVSPTRRADYDASLAVVGYGNAQYDEPTGQWQAPIWSDYGQAANPTWSQAPDTGANRPIFQAPDDDPGIGLGRGFRSLPRWVWPAAGIAALIWLGAAMVYGFNAVPGINNEAILRLLVLALAVWLVGSVVLRWGGVLLFIWTIWQTAADYLIASTSLLLVGLSVAMWLGGHWLYTFKYGQWRSYIAMLVLERLPGGTNPTWRWQERAITLD